MGMHNHKVLFYFILFLLKLEAEKSFHLRVAAIIDDVEAEVASFPRH